MTRQHCRPLLVSPTEADSAIGLERISLAQAESGTLPEVWLQELLFRNPELLPLSELEPAYAPAIPICRELPTAAGPIDILLISPTGQLTIVECKLWRNPEARREVIGQILDYAKELSRWHYSDLVEHVSRALAEGGDPVYSKVSQFGESPELHEFADSVARNLRLGRFLLIIAGDGIKENVERMAEFLQANANLHFSLALVELALYRLPPPSDRILVQPRVIARTVEIERMVVRVEAGEVSVATPPWTPSATGRPGRRTRLTEEEFFEALQVGEETKAQLRNFLTACESIGLETEISARLHIKLEGRYNFGSFSRDGTFRNYSLVSKLRQDGHREIAVRYLTELAALVPGAFVEKHTNDFRWSVRGPTGDLEASAILAAATQWLGLMERTKGQIEDAMAKQRELEGGA